MERSKGLSYTSLMNTPASLKKPGKEGGGVEEFENTPAGKRGGNGN